MSAVARHAASTAPCSSPAGCAPGRFIRGFDPVAAAFNFATSSSVRLRYSPGGTSSDRGPYCTRRIFSTWCPTSSNILRTWRLRPSMMVTSSQGLSPSRNQLDLRRSGAHAAPALFGDGDAEAKLFELGFVGSSRNFDHIGFRHVRRGLHQRIGERAIIGEQQQAFAGPVESSDGINAAFDRPARDPSRSGDVLDR